MRSKRMDPTRAAAARLFPRHERRQQRGAATIEMALMLVIFVPLVFFTMYASDAVFHLLNVQEAVVTTLWDMSTQSFSQEPNPRTARSNANNFVDNTVAGFDRVAYFDMASEYNAEKEIDSNGTSYKPDKKHLTQAFGQASWCNSENNCQPPASDYNTAAAQEVHCQLDQGGIQSFYLDLGAIWYSQTAGAGGIVTCSAKAWLYNYLIPKDFLPGFGRANQVKLFNKSQHHEANALAISGQDPQKDLLLKFRASLLVDTWAVTDGREINRSSGLFGNDRGVGPNSAFFQRTRVVFSNPLWYLSPTMSSMSYSSNAGDSQLADVSAFPETMLSPDVISGPNPVVNVLHPFLILADNVLGLAMNAQYEGDNSSNINEYRDGDFFTTPLYNDARTAYNNRGKYYLGMRNAETR
jgi:hypothetical protein